MFGKKWSAGKSQPSIDPKIQLGYEIALEEADILIKAVNHNVQTVTALSLSPTNLVSELDHCKNMIAEWRRDVAGQHVDFVKLAAGAEAMGDRMNEIYDQLANVEDIYRWLPEGGIAGCNVAWASLEAEAERRAGKTDA